MSTPFRDEGNGPSSSTGIGDSLPRSETANALVGFPAGPPRHEAVALADEVFALSFELQTLAGVVHSGLERWVPGFTWPEVEQEHETRYRWASEFTRDRRVLDIACGAGRGSRMLAELGAAREVMACDIDPAVVRYASIRNPHGRVRYLVADAARFASATRFDVIVSFETIEHVPDWRAFLRAMYDVLDDAGVFLVSTPVSAQALDERPGNRFHQREWGFREFQRAVGEVFTVQDVYVQVYMPSPGSFATRASRRLWRILRRIPHPPRSPAVIRRWDGRQLPAGEMGRRYRGYQILSCRK